MSLGRLASGILVASGKVPMNVALWKWPKTHQEHSTFEKHRMGAKPISPTSMVIPWLSLLIEMQGIHSFCTFHRSRFIQRLKRHHNGTEIVFQVGTEPPMKVLLLLLMTPSGNFFLRYESTVLSKKHSFCLPVITEQILLRVERLSRIEEGKESTHN